MHALNGHFERILPKTGAEMPYIYNKAQYLPIMSSYLNRQELLTNEISYNHFNDKSADEEAFSNKGINGAKVVNWQLQILNSTSNGEQVHAPDRCFSSNQPDSGWKIVFVPSIAQIQPPIPLASNHQDLPTNNICYNGSNIDSIYEKHC